MSELVYDTPLVKLYLGDAGKLDMLEDNSVDLFVTSPPYNIGDARWHTWSPSWYGQYGDVLPQDEYEKWQIALLEEWYKKAQPGAALAYVHKTCTRDFTVRHPYHWLQYSPWQLVQEIIWERQSTVQNDEARLRDVTERVYWLSKGKPRYFNPACFHYGTIWRIRFDVKSAVDHPAPFPYALAHRCIQCWSREGELIVDPFSGSGTTIMAGRDEKRRAVGVDIDRRYLEDSILRLQKETLGY